MLENVCTTLMYGLAIRSGALQFCLPLDGSEWVVSIQGVKVGKKRREED